MKEPRRMTVDLVDTAAGWALEIDPRKFVHLISCPGLITADMHERLGPQQLATILLPIVVPETSPRIVRVWRRWSVAMADGWQAAAERSRGW